MGIRSTQGEIDTRQFQHSRRRILTAEGIAPRTSVTQAVVGVREIEVDAALDPTSSMTSS